MAFSYRSAFPAFLLGLAPFSLGCAPLEPEVVTLEIRAHSLDATERCKIASNPDVTLQALGPFPVSQLAAERLPFHTQSRTLSFPDDTRGVEATVDDGSREWLGYSERRSENRIDVLLWEAGVGCELFRGATMSYPGADGGQAVGYSPETGVVLAAGGDEASVAAGSLTFDSGTGESALVDSKLSFSEARAYATVTPFGSKLLLAAGESPLETSDPSERETRDSAAVYDPRTGGFERDNIELEYARTRHAAIVLENGDTLLVGGGRSRGDGTTVIVPPFEVITPSTRRSRIDGLAQLAEGRLEPSAVRLENGNILVAGGYDTSREPIGSLEWFSPDGSAAVSPGTEPLLLEPRHRRALIALPGGGALTVGGCRPADRSDPIAECERACGVGFGCPANAFDADWIAPDGALTKVELTTGGRCGAFVPERVLLAAGSDGSPWLLAFDDDVSPPCRAVYRFRPWDDEPTFQPVNLDLEPWPAPRTRLTSLGPDVFVWLGDDDPPSLFGTRVGSRGALSQNETLLIQDPTSPSAPLHLAPDRQRRASGLPTQFADGRLILETPNDLGEVAVSVFVTDARYDDVTISIGFTLGAPVVLVGSYELGGRDCTWPSDPTSPIVVTRKGKELTAVNGTGKKITCKNVPSGSRSIGFRAGTTTAAISSLGVERI